MVLGLKQIDKDKYLRQLEITTMRNYKLIY